MRTSVTALVRTNSWQRLGNEPSCRPGDLAVGHTAVSARPSILDRLTSEAIAAGKSVDDTALIRSVLGTAYAGVGGVDAVKAECSRVRVRWTAHTSGP